MREAHLVHLRCPACSGELAVQAVTEHREGRIVEGALTCGGCPEKYPVHGAIPRFVPRENYASGFGLEWTRHARTQYDSYSGIPLSERRFVEETRWPRDLTGELILEAGSGSGRFTEHAAATGAFVVSMDYSFAVEANYRSNGERPNVLIVQADIVRPPFAPGSFDRVFCFGVLQHTPDPRRSFLSLVRQLKPGGVLAVDVYRKSLVRSTLSPKYWVRPLTRRVPPETLYRWVTRYVDLMWPLATQIRRIPRIGPALNWRLLVADYSAAGLRGAVLKEWAYLDTFDMLAPRYDGPQTVDDMRRWFREAGLTEVDVRLGYNGIEGRGIRPGDAVTPQSAAAVSGPDAARGANG